MLKRPRLLLLIALSCIAAEFTACGAVAATASATFGVSVMVQSACSVTASSIRFGTYDGTTESATSTISVTCTHSTPYNVGLSEGLGPSATVSRRLMMGPGSALLGYSLKPGGGKLTNWGHTVGVDTVGGTGNGSVQTISVLGQIPGGQSVADGGYSDTVTVTVSY